MPVDKRELTYWGTEANRWYHRQQQALKTKPTVTTPAPATVIRVRVADLLNVRDFDGSDRKDRCCYHDIKKSGGQMRPIVVRKTPDGKYRVVDGSRRAATAKYLELETVPAEVLP